MIFHLVIALATACVTWVVGWWGVAIVALVAGYLFRRDGGRAWRVALGAAEGWGILLVVDLLGGRFAATASAVAGSMRLPAFALLLVTLLFPALIGWSGATLGAARRASPTV